MLKTSTTFEFVTQYGQISTSKSRIEFFLHIGVRRGEKGRKRKKQGRRRREKGNLGKKKEKRKREEEKGREKDTKIAENPEKYDTYIKFEHFTWLFFKKNPQQEF